MDLNGEIWEEGLGIRRVCICFRLRAYNSWLHVDRGGSGSEQASLMSVNACLNIKQYDPWEFSQEFP